MKNRLLLLILLTMVSCIHTKYFVFTENELNNINLGKCLINIIPISKIDYQKDSIVFRTCNFLSEKNASGLRKYLNNISDTKSKSSYYLSNSLYYINRCEYKSAMENLQKIDTTDFKPIRELLLIDVTYEINKEIGVLDYKKYLNDYQSLIDKYQDNEQLKKIVAIRIRYLRYNY